MLRWRTPGTVGLSILGSIVLATLVLLWRMSMVMQTVQGLKAF